MTASYSVLRELQMVLCRLLYFMSEFELVLRPLYNPPFYFYMYTFRGQIFENEDAFKNYLDAVKPADITDADKQELLAIFKATADPLVWNLLAQLFAVLNADELVPAIIAKIKDPQTFGRNGALVAALSDLDCSAYFLFFVEVICTMTIAAQWGAMDIIFTYEHQITEDERAAALQILYSKQEEKLLKIPDFEPQYIADCISLLEGTEDDEYESLM